MRNRDEYISIHELKTILGESMFKKVVSSVKDAAASAKNAVASTISNAKNKTLNYIKNIFCTNDGVEKFFEVLDDFVKDNKKMAKIGLYAKVNEKKLPIVDCTVNGKKNHLIFICGDKSDEAGKVSQLSKFLATNKIKMSAAIDGVYLGTRDNKKKLFEAATMQSKIQKIIQNNNWTAKDVKKADVFRQIIELANIKNKDVDSVIALIDGCFDGNAAKDGSAAKANGKAVKNSKNAENNAQFFQIEDFKGQPVQVAKNEFKDVVKDGDNITFVFGEVKVTSKADAEIAKYFK